ncbi:hypothetical protein AB1Y20_017940 [Prymnesium parvum]|uniref:Transmembrane 9 superfamily member n=1 Tax=Prymnesium parvum TaxID=97485 RepID=A0AB34JQ71_PRYPA
MGSTFKVLMLLASATRSIAQESSEDEVISKENEDLKQRIQELETQLDRKWGYMVVKGMIVDAENIFMETMEVEEAKQYCNSRPECKGFTFGGPEERPEDEVTVTFKSGSKMEHDMNWVSYVKESNGAFGAIGDAAMQLGDAHTGSSIAIQSITYEVLCLLIAASLAVVFCCRRRASRSNELLPGPRL